MCVFILVEFFWSGTVGRSPAFILPSIMMELWKFLYSRSMWIHSFQTEGSDLTGKRSIYSSPHWTLQWILYQEKGLAFWGLSLALRSHDQFKASQWPTPPPQVISKEIFSRTPSLDKFNFCLLVQCSELCNKPVTASDICFLIKKNTKINKNYKI